MIQRILILTRYFLRTLFTSLAGVIYVILTLAYWVLLFNPQQPTPDVPYYQLVIGAFGTGIAFLIVLTMAAQANRAHHYPLLVRLPSRVEYVTAVLLSALLAAFSLQILLALLALINGPSFGLGHILELPPIWLAPMILAAVLALHATDLITVGWSRIYVFGVLAILLFGQSITNDALANFAQSLSRISSNQGWVEISRSLTNYANSLNNSNSNFIGTLFGFIFWPFRAVAEAAINGYFTATQALAPAIMLLYATILFLLAADFFASKDLHFTE